MKTTTALVKHHREEIPDAHLVKLQNRLLQIKFQQKALQIEEDKIHSAFEKAFTPGRYKHMTVYDVDVSWVKRHQRKSHRVFRTVLRKGKK